jgi:hypothetical protein
MASVVDRLREEMWEEVRRMTVSQRLALALRLGDDDLELFSRARNIDRESGIALLRRGRQLGRRPSRCFDVAL